MVEKYAQDVMTFVEYQPLVVILRGMYGSGKSTFANELVFQAISNSLTACVCSADHYFTDVFGQYNYSGNEIEDAHAYCLHRFHMAFEEPYSLIVVDNTNLAMDDFRAYYDFAVNRPAELKVVEFECPNVATAHNFRNRSAHDIPASIIESRWTLYNRNRLPMSNPFRMIINTVD